MRRIVSPLLALAVVAGFVPSSAQASSARPSILVTPAGVHGGETVRVHGNAGGCPGGSVTLISRLFVHTYEFAGVSAIRAHVSSGGVYSVFTTIPRARRLGRYTVAGRCGGGNLGVFATVRLTPRRTGPITD